MATRTGNGDSNGALSLRSWAAEAEAAAHIARSLAPTAFVPDHLRVWLNPDAPPAKRELDYDSTVAQIAAVLLAGQELEFGPMASLRAFVIIRGTVALYAIASRALLLRHGHEIVVVESTSQRAVVRGRRAGSDLWQESTWDLDRARTAHLFPGDERSNWRRQTKAMLVARATAEAARWVASDAMLGLPLIAEELQDADHEVIPEIPEAADPASAPGDGGKRTAKRKNTVARAALPAAPPPPPPPAPVPEDPAPAGPKASKPQLTKLHAALGDIHVTGRPEGLALISAWVDRKVASTTSLTVAELNTVFGHIEDIRAAKANDQHEDAPPPDDKGGPPADAKPD